MSLGRNRFDLSYWTKEGAETWVTQKDKRLKKEKNSSCPETKGVAGPGPLKRGASFNSLGGSPKGTRTKLAMATYGWEGLAGLKKKERGHSAVFARRIGPKKLNARGSCLRNLLQDEKGFVDRKKRQLGERREKKRLQRKNP